MLVAEKKAVNLSMPLPLVQEFDRLAEGLSGKQKWVLASAAWLAFLEANPAERRRYMTQVMGADLPGGSFEELIEHARRLADDDEGHAGGAMAKLGPDTPKPGGAPAAAKPPRQEQLKGRSAAYRKPDNE